MSEPIKQDRAAQRGKFCIWIETVDGLAVRQAQQFDSEHDAVIAGDLLMRSREARDVARCLVYDEHGMLRRKWTNREWRRWGRRRTTGRNPPKPIALAFVLCERVERDSSTGRMDLRGIVLRTHHESQDLMLYVLIDGGKGHYEQHVELVHEPSGSREFLPESLGGQFDGEPGRQYENTFRLASIRFPRPGPFRFELYCNGELLASYRFDVSAKL